MYLYFVPQLRPRFNFRGELFRHMKEQHAALPDELVRTGDHYQFDQIAPAGPTSIEGVNRLPWSSPTCEFSS